MDKHTEKIEELVKKYGDMVYRLAMIRTRNRESSEDIFQEVFLRICKRMPDFASKEHEKAWIIRVTINCSKNFLNSFWNKKVDLLEQDMCIETPEERDVWEMLEKLAENDRVILHLYYWEGYSIKEIAEILKMKENTVKTKMARAKEKVRKEWKGGENNG